MSSFLCGKWPGMQLQDCIVVLCLVIKHKHMFMFNILNIVIKETHKLFFQKSVHKYFRLSASKIFVSFDCHVSCSVSVSLAYSVWASLSFLDM